SRGAEMIVAMIEASRRRWPDIDHWLVAIDTLARCFGDGDENATRDMNTFVGRCDTIRIKSRAAVLVLHHLGNDQSTGLRGSIALKAAADTIIEIDGIEDTRTARVDKLKDGAVGDLCCSRLKPIEVGTDDVGDPIISCVIVEADAPPPQRKTAKHHL